MTYTPALPPGTDDSLAGHHDDVDQYEMVDPWGPLTFRERLGFWFWACVPVRLHPQRTLGRELKSYCRRNYKYLQMTD
jgi:hypothetical protein